MLSHINKKKYQKKRTRIDWGDMTISLFYTKELLIEKRAFE